MIQQFHVSKPKRIESKDLKRYLCPHAHSSIIFNHQKWKQTKFLLMDGWINELRHIHTMEYYSALKGEEIMRRYNMDET